jgi:hypothetical protein
LEYLISDFNIIMIYMHLLSWVGFGLIGYVPNTLYKSLFRCLDHWLDKMDGVTLHSTNGALVN